MEFPAVCMRPIKGSFVIALLRFSPLVFKAEYFFPAAIVFRLPSHGGRQTAEKQHYDGALHAR
jgi:hypothetical protein